MTTVKKFDFRCCLDEDFEDIERLLGPSPHESFALNSSQQWYCLEAKETNDELLAVGRLSFGESRPLTIDLVRFGPLSSSISNSQQVSAQQYFIQKLTHVSLQLTESASGLELLLNDYDEGFVDIVRTLGWQEKAGYFSSELCSMVHEFVFGEASSASISDATDELEFEIVDDSGPSSGMKNIMETLFNALHKEEGEKCADN